MKHPSDIAWPGFEPRCCRSVTNLATSQAMGVSYSRKIQGSKKRVNRNEINAIDNLKPHLATFLCFAFFISAHVIIEWNLTTQILTRRC